MTVTLRPLLAACLALLLSACVVVAPGGTGTGTPPAASTMADSTGFGAALNARRASAGLGPIPRLSLLQAAADRHVRDMTSNGFFSHTGSDGSSIGTRLRAAGWCSSGAENLAYGQQTVEQVMAGWMASSGHRRNILLANAVGYGIGRSGDTWVLVVGGGC